MNVRQLDLGETRACRVQTSCRRLCRLSTVHEHVRQTDRQTNRQDSNSDTNRRSRFLAMSPKTRPLDHSGV